MVMIDENVRKQLPPDALVFDNQSYDKSIIGVTLDGRVIYCLELMIEELSDELKCDYTEAYDWISYNTIQSLPYAGEKAPLIVSWEVYYLD